MADSILNNFMAGFENNQLAEDSALIYINLDNLFNREDNRIIDNDKVEEIAKSIKQDGLGQAILVRRRKEGGFEVIAGQHRVEAFRLLASVEPDKYAKIPAIEKHLDDRSARRLMLATNVVNNALSPEDRQKALVELFNEAKELREERKEEYKGKKTAEVVSDMLEEETGVKISRATVERDLKKVKEEKIENKCEFVEQNLTSNWQQAQLYATELKDDTLKTLSKCSADTQSEIAEVVWKLNPKSKNESKQMTESALKIKQAQLDKLCDRGLKSIDKYFLDLAIAQNLGEDISEQLLDINNRVVLRLKELGVNYDEDA